MNIIKLDDDWGYYDEGYDSWFVHTSCKHLIPAAVPYKSKVCWVCDEIIPDKYITLVKLLGLNI